MNIDKKPHDVQPFVKGTNILNALKSLLVHIVDLNGKVKEITKAQSELNALLETHQHPFNGSLTDPPSLGKNIDAHKQQCVISKYKILKLHVPGLDEQVKSLKSWERKWLSPSSKDWILSKFNGTN